MSAFDGLICKCGQKIDRSCMVTSREDWMDEGYPILADDGFWEYLYRCPKCGRTFWRPRIGDDYSNGI